MMRIEGRKCEIVIIRPDVERTIQQRDYMVPIHKSEATYERARELVG